MSAPLSDAERRHARSNMRLVGAMLIAHLDAERDYLLRTQPGEDASEDRREQWLEEWNAHCGEFNDAEARGFDSDIAEIA